MPGTTGVTDALYATDATALEVDALYATDAFEVDAVYATAFEVDAVYATGGIEEPDAMGALGVVVAARRSVCCRTLEVCVSFERCSGGSRAVPATVPWMAFFASIVRFRMSFIRFITCFPFDRRNSTA